MNERELIDSFLADPDGNWHRFSGRYASLIERCVRFSRIPNLDIDDALQEVYFELLRNDMKRLRQWNPERGSFAGFLKVVVSRLLVDLFRRTHWEETSMSEAFADEKGISHTPEMGASDATPREEAVDEERLEAVWRETESLLRAGRAKPMDVIILRQKVLGLDSATIARGLGISAGLVDLRYHRVKANLRGRLVRLITTPSSPRPPDSTSRRS